MLLVQLGRQGFVHFRFLARFRNVFLSGGGVGLERQRRCRRRRRGDVLRRTLQNRLRLDRPRKRRRRDGRRLLVDDRRRRRRPRHLRRLRRPLRESVARASLEVDVTSRNDRVERRLVLSPAAEKF